jgi:hypothetical protein
MPIAASAAAIGPASLRGKRLVRGLSWWLATAGA